MFVKFSTDSACQKFTNADFVFAEFKMWFCEMKSKYTSFRSRNKCKG